MSAHRPIRLTDVSFRTRLAQAARVDDFCSSDISHPSRERTLLLLSAFINFVKFTEQLCEPFVRGLRERSEVLLTERDQVTEQLSALQQKIDATKYVLSSSSSEPVLKTR